MAKQVAGTAEVPEPVRLAEEAISCSCRNISLARSVSLSLAFSGSFPYSSPYPTELPTPVPIRAAYSHNASRYVTVLTGDTFRDLIRTGR
jgi:hypothetical protein